MSTEHHERKITSADIEVFAKAYSKSGLDPSSILFDSLTPEQQADIQAFAESDPERFGEIMAESLAKFAPEAFIAAINRIEVIYGDDEEARQQLKSEMLRSSFDAQQQSKIQRPPGSLLLRAAETLVGKKRFERDCMGALADWHGEYFEALDQERGKAKMAAIRIRHTYAFLKATGWLVGLETVAKLMAKLIDKFSGA